MIELMIEFCYLGFIKMVKGIYNKIYDSIQSMFYGFKQTKDTSHIKYNINDENNIYTKAAREARDEYNTKNNELNNKKNELTKIDKILNIDYGHGNLFASLINECFETKVNKYTYKFCPFNEVRQKENNVGSGTNLGSYKSIIYNDKIIMEFDNGQKCWNGPNRSTKIIFECYHENTIKSVQEPSTCKYEMIFQTPLGCKHSHIKDIDDIIINTFKSEL